MTPSEETAARSAELANPAPIDVGAIAFDLDGTLLDTVHELAAAVNALLAELGYPPLAQDVVGALIGKGMANLVRRALALATGVSPEAVDDGEVKDALGRVPGALRVAPRPRDTALSGHGRRAYAAPGDGHTAGGDHQQGDALRAPASRRGRHRALLLAW